VIIILISLSPTDIVSPYPNSFNTVVILYSANIIRSVNSYFGEFSFCVLPLSVRERILSGRHGFLPKLKFSQLKILYNLYAESWRIVASDRRPF